MTRLPPSERRAHRPLARAGLHVRRQAGDGASRATRSARRCSPAGQRTFSRSFKYHRPRGLLCCAGQCPNCLVQVDGAPGVRACTEPLREGMKVEHMNASPSLDFDVMRATDLVGGAVHAARLLLQDLHPAAPPLAALREGAAPRRRPRQAAPQPARARVAHRVPPPPRRRAGRGRRRGRADAPPSPPPSWAPTWCSCDEGPEPGGRLLRRGRSRARARADRAGPRRRRGGARERPGAGRLRRPGAGLAGRHAAPGARAAASSTPPARSSSRCCSPATTCPA